MRDKKQTEPLLQLQKQLQQGLPLPKDVKALNGFGHQREHRFEARDKRDEREILKALIERGTHQHQRQALEIARCTRHRPCGHWACYLCRNLQWQEDRDELEPHALSVNYDVLDISYATIVVGATHGGKRAVKRLLMEAVRRIRNVLEPWPSVAVSGRFEVDCHWPGHLTGTYKRRTLKSCGYRSSARSPALVPHLHAIIVHPGIKREAVRLFLRKKFPGYRRVQARPLDVTQSLETNLDNLVRYSLKFEFPDNAIPTGQSQASSEADQRKIMYFYKLIEYLGGFNGVLDFKVEPQTHNIDIIDDNI